jgi:hypothetical protein
LKEAALVKLRRERDDLSALVSQDQFKSIKAVETSLMETVDKERGLKALNKKITEELH